jgi:hypothetical protein
MRRNQQKWKSILKEKVSRNVEKVLNNAVKQTNIKYYLKSLDKPRIPMYTV